jgi:hypothetical protein
MIENMIRNFRALWRAESIITDLHFRELLSRLMLKAFAGLIAVFGLLMLNISAFFAIEQYFGRIWSAASVSLFDFIVAGILVVIAKHYPKSRELGLALEVRQQAIQGFESDARLVQSQFSALADEIRGIKTSMTNFVRHPLDETLSQIIAPLAAIVIRSLGKKRSSGKSTRSSGRKKSEAE